MKGWTWAVVAVVALLTAAQTTAMALLGDEESASVRGGDDVSTSSRCHLGDDCLVKRAAGGESSISATMVEADLSTLAKTVHEEIASISTREKRETEESSFKSNRENIASPILNSGDTAASAKAKNTDTRFDKTSSMVKNMQENTFSNEKMAKEAEDSRCHMENNGNECLVKREVGEETSEVDMSTLTKIINEEITSILNRKRRGSEGVMVEANRDNSSPFVKKENEMALARINNGGGGGHQPPTERSRLARDEREFYLRTSVTGEDNTSNIAKSMKRWMARKKTEECIEDEPSVETRGLLDGLLGGGGSGENCTAQGETCSGGTCCPDLICVDVDLLGLSLCL